MWQLKAFLPELIDQIWRSWSSSTPGKSVMSLSSYSMLTFAGLASMRTMMQSLKTGIEVHMIITENK
jgi:hypothetical protein